MALSILPLLSPTPSPFSRTTAVLLAAGAVFLLWKARGTTTPLDELERQLDTLAARHPRRLTIQLTHTPADELGTGGNAYAATVIPPSGAEVPLTRAREPATVLAVARYWQRRLKARLAPGWGLSNEDLAAIDRAPRFTVRPSEHVGPGQDGARAASISLLCCAVALGLLVGTVATLRQRPSSTTSFALFGLGISLLLVLALAAHTDRVRVSIEEGVAIERRCLGFLLRRFRVNGDAIHFLRLVSPEAARGRHLLLATRHGFGAVECQHDLGRVVEKAISPTDIARAR